MSESRLPEFPSREPAAGPHRVRATFPSSIRIDGREIRLSVKRLDVAEYSAFARGRQRIAEPESERRTLVRRLPDEFERVAPGADDVQAQEAQARELAALEQQASDLLAHTPGLESQAIADTLLQVLRFAAGVLKRVTPEDRYRVSDELVRERRIAEMTPAEAAAYREVVAEEERYLAEFVIDVISRYVAPAPRQFEIEEDDGSITEVVTGAQLVRIFASRPRVLRGLLDTVWYENTLTDALKNVWRSGSGSTPSSSTRAQEAGGPTPEPPVADAVSEASAPIAAATESSVDSTASRSADVVMGPLAWSGSTATSS